MRLCDSEGRPVMVWVRQGTGAEDVQRAREEPPGWGGGGEAVNPHPGPGGGGFFPTPAGRSF